MNPRTPESIYRSDLRWNQLTDASKQQVKNAVYLRLKQILEMGYEKLAHQYTFTGFLLWFKQMQFSPALNDDVTQQLFVIDQSILDLDLLTIKTLAQEAFLCLYSEATSDVGKTFSYFLFSNTPEQIREWGHQLKSHNQNRIEISLDRLNWYTAGADSDPTWHLTHTLSPDQYAALKEALSGITELVLVNDPAYDVCPPELWTWLAGLFNEVKHLTLCTKSIDESCFAFNKESLRAFGAITRSVTYLDLTNVEFAGAGHEDTDETREYMRIFTDITQCCDTLHFRNILNLPVNSLSPFFSARHRSKLMLNEIPIVNIQALLALLKQRVTIDDFMGEPQLLPVIRATTIELCNNQLNVLEDGEWETLCSVAKDTQYLNLSGNNLSGMVNCSNRLPTILKFLSAFELVNLDNNGFDKHLETDKWAAFCSALRISGIYCLAPLTELSDQQQTEFNSIMLANAFRASLKTGMKRFFLLQALPEKIPVLSAEFKEEAEPLLTALKNF